MSPSDFCDWLKDYIESSGELTVTQTNMIRLKLHSVGVDAVGLVPTITIKESPMWAPGVQYEAYDR